jgi:hypothetical protein
MLVWSAVDSSAEAPTEKASLVDVINIEFWPLWLNFGKTNRDPPAHAVPVAPGLAGGVRLLTLRGTGWYWTPLVAGLGVSGSMFAEVGTELGTRVSRGKHFADVGAGFGYGTFGVYAGQSGCDDTCIVGGGPWLFSPALRYGRFRPSGRSWGIVVRAVIPTAKVTHEKPVLGGLLAGYAASVLIGLDVGLGRRL